MSGGVLVPRIKSGNERGRKRNGRRLEPRVSDDEILRQTPLVVVEAEQALSGKSRHEEEEQRPRGDLLVRICKHRDDRRIQRHGQKYRWTECAKELGGPP